MLLEDEVGLARVTAFVLKMNLVPPIQSVFKCSEINSDTLDTRPFIAMSADERNATSILCFSAIRESDIALRLYYLCESAQLVYGSS